MSTDRTALEGIRVVDITQVMAGPFCAMQLCDMGADVIKVEPPGGDTTRTMAGAIGSESPAFNAVNRGKRGIVLDLKTDAGRTACRRLVARTDIVIENYRPGVMHAFGLDWESAEYFSDERPPAPMGSAHRLLAPYQAVRCGDGYITLAAATDRLFQRLCELLGHAEWSHDPDFVEVDGRVRNRAALMARIEAVTTGQPCAHWLAVLEASGIPCGPIQDYAQAFADPQIRARAMVVDTEHPTLGRLQTLGSPIKMSVTPPVAGRRAPLLGEHTIEVLGELGLSGLEIDAVTGAARDGQ
ncbi:MAG: CoA transferase [Acidobacteria bacterium]|nr:CoA transferase [Acidobacteriota bacterium]